MELISSATIFPLIISSTGRHTKSQNPQQKKKKYQQRAGSPRVGEQHRVME
jgi:hypothetical protein